MLFIQPRLPADTQNYLLINDMYNFGTDFMYASGNNPNTLTVLSRLPQAVLVMILGFFIFLWAKQLYNYKAGIIALLLFIVSPSILAQSSLATNDFGISAFIFFTIYALWFFLQKINWKRGVLLGICLGLALTTKLTSLMLIPIIIVTLGIHVAKRSWKRKKLLKYWKKNKHILGAMALVFLTTYLFINLLYGFQGTFTSLGNNLAGDPSEFIDPAIYNSEALSKMAPAPLQGVAYGIIEYVPIFVPYHYLKDFVTGVLNDQSEKSAGGFFLGKLRTGHSYYPLIFLFKTPLPTLILLAIAIFVSLRINNWKDEIFLAIIPVLFLVYFTMGQTWGGLRYILPIYPFLFVFIGKIGTIRVKSFNIFVGSMIILLVASSVSAAPYYFSYFNEAIRTPHKIATAADLDNGQSLKELAEYFEDQQVQNVKLAYFGKASPEYYGLTPEYLANFASNDPNEPQHCSPTEGTIAISATYLQESVFLDDPQCFAWLRKHTPTKIIGESIFIYTIQ